MTSQPRDKIRDSKNAIPPSLDMTSIAICMLCLIDIHLTSQLYIYPITGRISFILYNYRLYSANVFIFDFSTSGKRRVRVPHDGGSRTDGKASGGSSAS